MYMALTEEQAREIRKLGITVIEWKWCVKENVKPEYLYRITEGAEEISS